MNIQIKNENIAGVSFCTLDLPKTIELLADWSGDRPPAHRGLPSIKLPPKDGVGPGEWSVVGDRETNPTTYLSRAKSKEPLPGLTSEATSSPLTCPELSRRNDSPVQSQVEGTTQPKTSHPRWFACVNPHSVESARRDPEFKAAVEGADLVTADGTGIVIGSIILGGNVRDRVCGPDIFPQLCDYLNERKAGTRMFFLGTNDKTLAALEKRFGEVYPHLVYAGGFAPPYRQQFSEEENSEMVERINAANADVLWVGLGAPKQEKWCHQNVHKLNVNLVGPVGGVFDFFTGRVKLPPKWAQELGMIWLWRLIQQPRRLLRRNLDAPVFLWHVFKQRLFSNR